MNSVSSPSQGQIDPVIHQKLCPQRLAQRLNLEKLWIEERIGKGGFPHLKKSCPSLQVTLG
jgi:hypothetical protein